MVIFPYQKIIFQIFGLELVGMVIGFRAGRFYSSYLKWDSCYNCNSKCLSYT